MKKPEPEIVVVVKVKIISTSGIEMVMMVKIAVVCTFGLFETHPTEIVLHLSPFFNCYVSWTSVIKQTAW